MSTECLINHGITSKKEKSHLPSNSVLVDKNDGNRQKCGRIPLKGKNGEFDKILKKARDVCTKSHGDDGSTLALFWKRKDDSETKIIDEKCLQGKFDSINTY